MPVNTDTSQEWNAWALWTCYRLLRAARDALEHETLLNAVHVYRLLMSPQGEPPEPALWSESASKLVRDGQYASAYAFAAACDAARLLCLFQTGEATRELCEASVKKALLMMESRQDRAHH